MELSGKNVNFNIVVKMRNNVYYFVLIVIVLIWHWSHVEPMYESFTTRGLKGYDERVVLSMPQSETAVKKLIFINEFLMKNITELQKRYENDNTKPIHQEITRRLVRDYRPGELFEQKPNDGSITSFVTNKGERMTVCLRNTTTHEFHNDNTVKFVCLHELAHIATKGIGHHHEFWRNFRIILEVAIEAGLYRYVNYAKHPVIYCGKRIGYTPMIDDRLDSVSIHSKDYLHDTFF
jgi:hypothetical protein